MAAPSDVRVEAQSITSTILRWTYSGTSPIAVYRSTDGSSYSEITGAGTQVAAGTTSYIDTVLSTGTKYWYKLSDDSGSTFSSVVTVTTMTCAVGTSDASAMQLPQATSDTVEPQTFNELSQRVEQGLNLFRSVTGQTCVACISDTTLVIDCIDFAGCNQVDVNVDQDINSITIANCDDSIQQVNFLIPPSTTRKICGWPQGFGFTGDECFRAPIAGGTAGRTMSVPLSAGKAKPVASKTGYGGAGGAGGSACTCVPGAQGQLTIVFCDHNSNSVCHSAGAMGFKVCGGKPPYTATVSGDLSLETSPGVALQSLQEFQGGQTIRVVPPTNSGSAVAGTAYWTTYWKCTGCSGGVCNTVEGLETVLFGCDDVAISCSGSSQCSPAPSATSMTCGCGSGSHGQAGCPDALQTCGDCGVISCADLSAGTGKGRISTTCDKRTAGMISDGCNPCGVAANGQTVFVTDALGTTTSRVLKA